MRTELEARVIGLWCIAFFHEGVRLLVVVTLNQAIRIANNRDH